MIRAEKSFKLLAQEETGSDLLKSVLTYKPHVVILDHQSDEFSIELIKKIKALCPETRMLIISSDLVRENIFTAIDLGANSFVTKHCSEGEIINAIKSTARNERFFCNRILEVFIARSENSANSCEPTELTDREVEILQLIGEGHSTKELAEVLHLSQHTIYTHRKNMMKKLGVKNSTDLILTAINLGLISTSRETV